MDFSSVKLYFRHCSDRLHRTEGNLTFMVGSPSQPEMGADPSRTEGIGPYSPRQNGLE